MENERQKLSTEVQIRILQNEIEHMKDDIEDHAQTLYNDGKGIVYHVNQLKRDSDSMQGRWAAIISILSVLISLVAVLLQIFDK